MADSEPASSRISIRLSERRAEVVRAPFSSRLCLPCLLANRTGAGSTLEQLGPAVTQAGSSCSTSRRPPTLAGQTISAGASWVEQRLPLLRDCSTAARSCVAPFEFLVRRHRSAAVTAPRPSTCRSASPAAGHAAFADLRTSASGALLYSRPRWRSSQLRPSALRAPAPYGGRLHGAIRSTRFHPPCHPNASGSGVTAGGIPDAERASALLDARQGRTTAC